MIFVSSTALLIGQMLVHSATGLSAHENNIINYLEHPGSLFFIIKHMGLSSLLEFCSEPLLLQ